MISLNLKFNLKNKSATKHKRERRNLPNSREGEKEPTKPKKEKSVRSPLKQCITALKFHM